MGVRPLQCGLLLVVTSVMAKQTEDDIAKDDHCDMQHERQWDDDMLVKVKELMEKVEKLENQVADMQKEVGARRQFQKMMENHVR